MRIKRTALATGLLLAALTACSGTNTQNSSAAAGTETAAKSGETMAEYHKLTAQEAKGRMDSGDEIVILDVRRQDEYDQAHIPGAILIPNEEITAEVLEELPDLNQEILVYCRSGNRSGQAARKLVEAGYTKVYDFGGIMDWPYETETGN